MIGLACLINHCIMYIHTNLGEKPGPLLGGTSDATREHYFLPYHYCYLPLGEDFV